MTREPHLQEIQRGWGEEVAQGAGGARMHDLPSAI